MRRNRFTTRALVMLLLAITGGPFAYGAGLQPQGLSKSEPVMLTANEVGYDQPNATAIAIGHVEVVQGDTVLLADRVTYNQATDEVHAWGNVSLLEPSGDVVFSSDAVLQDKMQKGVVEQFRARLKDNSLFAAREGQKISPNITVMHDAVYSPCKVCVAKDGEAPSAPLWQVEAKKATIDENEQRVFYENAFVDVYGVPVIYTPYFSHPTPDAPSETGFMTPQYYHSSELGNVIKEPLFISLASNMDMTITPWYMTGEKPMLQGEFEHLTEEGKYTIRGAITDTYNRDEYGNVIPGDEIRGFIEAHGNLQVSQFWDVGVDAERVTDDTFLELYGFPNQTILNSRIYAERVEERNYDMVEGLAFQGLQTTDIGAESPYVEQAEFHHESDPILWRSHLFVDTNVMGLERSEGDSDQRVSSTVGWKAPYITPNGQVIDVSATIRGDAYNIQDQPLNTTGSATYSGDEERLIPELDINWRYPFVNNMGNGRSLIVAPIVEVTESPNLHASSKIPDEDSQVAELSDINLFSPDRYTGLDLIESGLRGTAGTRGQYQWGDTKWVEWLLGQTFEDNIQNEFPIAQDPNAHSSDYIGRLATKYKWIDLAYSFRVDRDTLALTSNEVTSAFVLSPVSLNLNFIDLHNEPLFGDRKEVSGSTSLEVTKNLTWNVNASRDLGSSATTTQTNTTSTLPINPLLVEPTAGTVGYSTNLVFHNECIKVITTAGRSYISLLDVRPSTTFGVVVVLQNFGGNTNTSSTTASNDNANANNIVNNPSVIGAGNYNNSQNNQEIH